MTLIPAPSGRGRWIFRAQTDLQNVVWDREGSKIEKDSLKNQTKTNKNPKI